MTPTNPPPAVKDLDCITANFAKVRVLHYAAEAPATAADIVARLSRHGAPARPAQLLASLVRCGLLRTRANPPNSTRQYCLTPKGRHLLAAAKEHLQRIPHE